MLKKHRVRSLKPERVREILRAEPLRVAPGVTEASTKHAMLILPRLQLVHEQKAQIERDIETLLEELSELNREKLSIVTHSSSVPCRAWGS